MKKMLLIISSVVVIVIPSLAQGLPDSIPFFSPTIQRYDELPVFGPETTFIDTLTDPTGYIYEENDEVVIIIKEKKEWVSWKLFEQSDTPGDNITSVERVDFGTGKRPALVIHWYYQNGRSGWRSGFDDHNEGVILWDLNNHERIMQFITNHEYNYHWNEFAEDTTGTIPYEELEIIDSGGESMLYQAEVTIEKDSIYIRETVNEDNWQVLELCRGKYVIRKDKLMLTNKECE